MANEDKKVKPKIRYQVGRRSKGWKDTIQLKEDVPDNPTNIQKDPNELHA